MGERATYTDWKDWRDVFASWTVIPSAGLSKFSARTMPERTAHTWKLDHKRTDGVVEKVPMYLSRFVRVERLDQTIYLDVVPTHAAIEVLTNSVTFVEHDTMNFEVIEWKDGRALVACHSSKIIGGPWVARIDASTIPAFPREDD